MRSNMYETEGTIGLISVSTQSGASCKWFPEPDGKAGWKAYQDHKEAYRSYRTQKYLHRHGLAPEVLSGFVKIEFCNRTPIPASRSRWVTWGYRTAAVDQAVDVEWRWLNADEDVNEEATGLIRDAGKGLLEEIHKLFLIDPDYRGQVCPHFDLHKWNWGFNEKSKPVVLDTGRHFYVCVPEEFQLEVIGEYLGEDTDQTCGLDKLPTATSLYLYQAMSHLPIEIEEQF